MDLLNFRSIPDHYKEQDIPDLSKSGQRAFFILMQGISWKKFHSVSQAVTPLDPPDIKIKGNVCRINISDFFVPETCDGDCYKVKYDSCDFPVNLLYHVLRHIYPGGKTTVNGKATFQSLLYEWGEDYEEFKRESNEEDTISLVLELSKNSRNLILTVNRNNQYYEKIYRKVNFFGVIK